VAEAEGTLCQALKSSSGSARPKPPTSALSLPRCPADQAETSLASYRGRTDAGGAGRSVGRQQDFVSSRGIAAIRNEPLTCGVITSPSTCAPVACFGRGRRTDPAGLGGCELTMTCCVKRADDQRGRPPTSEPPLISSRRLDIRAARHWALVSVADLKSHRCDAGGRLTERLMRPGGI